MKKTLIMVSGGISAGKDTFATYVMSKEYFKQLAFADYMKSNLFNLLSPICPNLTLNHFYDQELKNEIIPITIVDPILPSSPRGAMQWYGELIKAHLGEHFWCKIVENKIKDSTDNIIITDARFMYELDYIRNSSFIKHNYNVFTILVNRDSEKRGNHISESHFLSYKHFDFIIDNNSTLLHYYAQIDAIMELIKKCGV